MTKFKNEEKKTPQTKTTKSKTALNLIWGGSVVSLGWVWLTSLSLETTFLTSFEK